MAARIGEVFFQPYEKSLLQEPPTVVQHTDTPLPGCFQIAASIAWPGARRFASRVASAAKAKPNMMQREGR
eukprot:6492734-Amphidinium_carterae.6